jgi:hypothetical protein
VCGSGKKLSEDKKKVQKQLKAKDRSAEQRTELEQKETELCVKLGAGGAHQTHASPLTSACRTRRALSSPRRVCLTLVPPRPTATPSPTHTSRPAAHTTGR